MGTHVISGKFQSRSYDTGTGRNLVRLPTHLRSATRNGIEHGIRHRLFPWWLSRWSGHGHPAINIYYGRSLLDSVLFPGSGSGLTPQFAARYHQYYLSHGAKKMAEKKVIIKRLESIGKLICARKDKAYLGYRLTVATWWSFDACQEWFQWIPDALIITFFRHLFRAVRKG